MESVKRIKEGDRMKMIVSFLKTGVQPEGYTVREDANGGYRVTAIKVKDLEAEKQKKRDRYVKKLIEIDPSLTDLLVRKQPVVDGHPETPLPTI